MRALLLAFAVFQTATAVPVQMAPSHCTAHAPAAPAGEHSGHHREHAPAPEGECSHCPPADCARHQACGQPASALRTEPAATPAAWSARRIRHPIPSALVSSELEPPTYPPRLIT